MKKYTEQEAKGLLQELAGMLTDANLLLERLHPSRGMGGVQRIYRFKNGMGLSVINATQLHSFPFAWEIAVISGVQDDGNFSGLVYDTELTSDVEVFANNEGANAFIAKAEKLFNHE